MSTNSSEHRLERSGAANSDEVFEAQFVGDQPPKRRRSWAGMVMIGLVIGILVVPLLYAWLPDETARWYLAAAQEQRLDGDLDGALVNLNKAIQRFPDQPELLYTRAEWLEETGKYEEALEDCNRVIELSKRPAQVYVLRSQVLQHLGRFDEGVEDMLKLLELSDQGRGIARPWVLNGLAYARALANSDLDQALVEIEEALAAVGGSTALIDTRGFIHYLRGDLDKALADLDNAVNRVEAEYAEFTKRFESEQFGVLDRREDQRTLKQHAQSVAVIRYHRSLVLDSLGETAKAEQDRSRVFELGYEPGAELF